MSATGTVGLQPPKQSSLHLHPWHITGVWQRGSDTDGVIQAAAVVSAPPFSVCRHGWISICSTTRTQRTIRSARPVRCGSRYWNSAESDDRKELVEDMKAELQKQEPLSVRW